MCSIFYEKGVAQFNRFSFFFRVHLFAYMSNSSGGSHVSMVVLQSGSARVAHSGARC
jgi:hypothetical protein